MPHTPVETKWDLPLRLFHWTMVSVVIVAGSIGFLAPAWWLDVHVIAGYALVVLLAFRLLWGFVGSPYSRFNSFPLKLDALREHLRSIVDGNPRRTIGHNPAGAWMIVVLLASLVTLAISGLVVLGGQENLGPLAAIISFHVGKFAGEIHETFAWVLVGAVVVHLSGVFVETIIFNHPVLSAMLIRWPRHSTGRSATGKHHTHTVRGLSLFVAVAGGLVLVAVSLSYISSASWRVVPAPLVYTSECGDCHDAYHPSLRTVAAWQGIMDGLADHYGEDASLDGNSTNVILDFLDINSAETFDTEISHRIGRVDTPTFRMTDTKYWKKRHENIEPTVFRLKSVGSKVNCSNCHTDAATGRFNDENIHIPSGDKI